MHPNHNVISSEDVQGTKIYDAAGKEIGEIDHMIIDKVSGRVAYAVMSFGGAAAAPLFFELFAFLNRALGYRQVSETSFRPDREIRRGR